MFDKFKSNFARMYVLKVLLTFIATVVIEQDIALSTALKSGSIEYERIRHYLIHFNDMLFYLKTTTD